MFLMVFVSLWIPLCVVSTQRPQRRLPEEGAIGSQLVLVEVESGLPRALL